MHGFTFHDIHILVPLKLLSVKNVRSRQRISTGLRSLVSPPEWEPWFHNLSNYRRHNQLGLLGGIPPTVTA